MQRTVRIFISSTFQDMHAERDCLVKRVFPRLEEWLAPYRLRLQAVDLRWGITKEEAENGRVLDLCLQEIERCRPFFIGLLGQRYGWVPPQISEESRRALGLTTPEVDQSITEMEILHGVMLSPAARNRALFCFRDPASLDPMSESIRATYEDTQPAQQQRLSKLKARIETSDFPVLRYQPEWDASRTLHGSDHTGVFVGLEKFEESVFKWLCKALSEERNLTESTATGDDDYDHLASALYVDSRLEGYVARARIEGSLLHAVDSVSRTPQLIIGRTGSGKSAALAWLIRQVEARPNWQVIYFFAGASQGQSHLLQLLATWCHELGAELPDVPTLHQLTELLKEYIQDVPPDRHLLLLADGLDVLEPQEQVRTLDWLPTTLPENVKIIASIRHSNAAPHFSVQRAKEIGIACIYLPNLDGDECAAILDKLPELSAKTLDNTQRNLLLANPATRNPLFLRTALSELKGHGRFETLNARIRALPHTDAGTDSDALLTALYGQIIERLMHDFDAAITRSVLLALACCRHGMSGTELVAYCAAAPGDEVHAVLRHLRDYTMMASYGIALRHRSFNDAVVEFFIAEPTDLQTVHASLARFFEEHLAENDRRRAAEAPWHYCEANDFRSLSHAILHPFVFNCLWETESVNLIRYWSKAKDAGFDMAHWTVHAAQKQTDNHAFVYNSARLLQMVGCVREFFQVLELLPKDEEARLKSSAAGTINTEALMLIKSRQYEKALERLTEAERLAEGNKVLLASIWGNMAIVHISNQRWDEGIRLMLKQERICRDHRLNKELCSCLGNLADTYSQTNRFEEAQALLQEKEHLCEAENHLMELQMCHGQWALYHERRSDHRAALAAAGRKEQICRDNGFRWDLDAALILKAGILNELGESSQALDCCDEALLEISKRSLAVECVEAYAMRSILLSNLEGRLEEAIHTAQRAIRLAEGSVYPGLENLRQLEHDLWSRRRESGRAGSEQVYVAMLEAAEQNDLAAIRQLHQAGCPLELPDTTTPLHYACRNGYTEIAEWLISAGASIDPLSMGSTPLHNAIGAGHEETFLLLLAQGASIERVPKSERPPIVQAARFGRSTMILKLIEQGAEVEQYDMCEEDGKNALMYAAKYAHPQVLRGLLQAGANPNARNRVNRRTPLMYACSVDSIEIVNLLLKAGADPFLRCAATHNAQFFVQSQAILDLLNDWRPTEEWRNTCLNRAHPTFTFSGTPHHVLDSVLAFVLTWKKNIPAACPFTVQDAQQTLAGIVDAALHLQSSAQRVFDPGRWYCLACGTLVPEDAVRVHMAEHYPHADECEDSKPSGKNDPDMVKDFLARHQCLACGATEFAVLNTTGQSEESRSQDLLCGPGFMAFMAEKLKTLDSWPPQLDDEAFMQLNVPALITRLESLVSKGRTLLDSQTGAVPNYTTYTNGEWLRIPDRQSDRYLIERLSDKTNFGYPIADANAVIQRAVETCVATTEARCVFLGIPFIWYKNTGQSDVSFDELQKRQRIAIENLFFELAHSENTVSSADVRREVERMLTGRVQQVDNKEATRNQSGAPEHTLSSPPPQRAVVTENASSNHGERDAPLDEIPACLPLETETDSQDNESKTPLMYAIGNRMFSQAMLLLEQGARAAAADRDGWTPLLILAATTCVLGGTEEEEQLAQCLIEAGANVNARNKNGDTALMIACAKANERLVRVLLTHGADPDIQAHDGSRACAFAETDEIRALVSGHRPPSPNEQLLAGARNGDVQQVSMSIAAGADVNVRTPTGSSAICIAAESGNIELLDILIKAEADINLSDETRRTPLMMAARCGHCKAVTRLLDAKANTGKQDKIGTTALHGAAINGHANIVAALLEAGVDPSIKNRLGYTARQVAEMNSQSGVVNVFDSPCPTPKNPMVKQQAIVSDDVVDIEEAPSLASSKINEAEASGKRFYPLKLNPLGIFISIPVLLFAGMLTLQSALILVTNIVLPWRDHSPFVSIIGIMFLSFFVISWATVFRWTFARILMVIFGKWGVTIGEDRVVFPGSLRGKKKIPFSSLDYVAIDECSGRTEVNFYRKGQMFFSSFRDITSDKFKDANTWMRFHEDLMAVLKSQAIIYYKNGLAITWRLSCLPEVTQLIEVREIAQSLAKNFSVSSKYVQLDRTEKVDDLAQLISKQIATCRGDIASLNFEVTLFPTLCSRASHIEIRAYTNDFEAHYAIWRNKNTLYIGKRKVERQKKHPKKSIPLQISHK